MASVPKFMTRIVVGLGVVMQCLTGAESRAQLQNSGLGKDVKKTQSLEIVLQCALDHNESSAEQMFKSQPGKASGSNDLPASGAVKDFNVKCNHKYAFSNVRSIYEVNRLYHDFLLVAFESKCKPGEVLLTDTPSTGIPSLSVSDIAKLKIPVSMDNNSALGELVKILLNGVGCDHFFDKKSPVCIKRKDTVSPTPPGATAPQMRLETNDECFTRLKRAKLDIDLQTRQNVLELNKSTRELTVGEESEADSRMIEGQGTDPITTALNDFIATADGPQQANGTAAPAPTGELLQTDLNTDEYKPEFEILDTKDKLKVARKSELDFNAKAAERMDIKKDGLEIADEKQEDALETERENALNKLDTTAGTKGQQVKTAQSLKKSYEHDIQETKDYIEEQKHDPASKAKGRSLPITLRAESVQFRVFKLVLDYMNFKVQKDQKRNLAEKSDKPIEVGITIGRSKTKAATPGPKPASGTKQDKDEGLDEDLDKRLKSKLPLDLIDSSEIRQAVTFTKGNRFHTAIQKF